MTRPVSLSVERVEVDSGQATVRGQVWLGPVEVGDHFTGLTEGIGEVAVSLRLEMIEVPTAAQEVGRVPRVIVVLTGDGVEVLRPGVVLLGVVDRPDFPLLGH